jgi:nicotinamide mononucleotide (NMN) deamidase PncC
MPPHAEDLVSKIHAAGARGVIAITGGGTAAIGRLCAVAGASATVLEAVVPYSAESLADWLGRKVENACSESAARAMAMVAWRRARELSGDEAKPAIGLGVTAALATNRPKRGEHRIHAAIQTDHRTAALTLTLEKGRRSREEEETIAAHTAVALLADGLGVHTLDLSRTPPGIDAVMDDCMAPPAWTELLLGRLASVAMGPVPTPPALLVPGSFNPPHAGHLGIASVAEARVGAPAVRELSVTNVDKPALDFLETKRRVEAIGGAPLLLTSAPTFVEKARLAPGCVFAIGADTAERIARGAYYGGDAARDRAVAEITRLGCRFLVFGRVEGDRFRELRDLDLPEALRAICDGVSEAEFREDVSSSALRA